MMKRKFDIQTIDELVKVYEGDRELAGRLGYKQNKGGTSVVNWRVNGEIPKGWHLRFYLGVRQAGYTVSPNVFGAQSWRSLALRPRKRNGPAVNS